MAGSSVPVYGHQLMSVRCLVTGKYAELKRQDGKSDKPGIFQPLTWLNATEVWVKQDSNKVCLKRSQT
ncbi:hypothetical protein CEW81_23985 [Kluyvera genomosp. 3]|uniref:Uncharacterized protein n=1 Tax=Kluyvera genomosp. 3 TaxID=2774055 RepID=A0A248KKN5_9ENTR|nr:hypothetical protein CEW81_23985 [Kluyvera genomosp. 3]